MAADGGGRPRAGKRAPESEQRGLQATYQNVCFQLQHRQTGSEHGPLRVPSPASTRHPPTTSALASLCPTDLPLVPQGTQSHRPKPRPEVKTGRNEISRRLGAGRKTSWWQCPRPGGPGQVCSRPRVSQGLRSRSHLLADGPQVRSDSEDAYEHCKGRRQSHGSPGHGWPSPLHSRASSPPRCRGLYTGLSVWMNTEAPRLSTVTEVWLWKRGRSSAHPLRPHTCRRAWPRRPVGTCRQTTEPCERQSVSQRWHRWTLRTGSFFAVGPPPHCIVLSGIPGLHPPDAGRTPPPPPNVSSHCQCSLRGQNAPLPKLRTAHRELF